MDAGEHVESDTFETSTEFFNSEARFGRRW